MMAAELVSEKINEIIAELKQLQLWRKQAPEWVTDFSHKEIISEEDFTGWLQFVFLPNLHQNERIVAGNYLAPQAMRFFGGDLGKGRLLRLLVELDSLS
jgi:uncharacterized protein YqcC (DUF446 family)